MAIGFSIASLKNARESISCYYTTSFIHSTAEIIAPNIYVERKPENPPRALYGDPCFLPDTYSGVDIFHDGIFATTTDRGQPRQVIDNPFIGAYGNIFYTLQYTKFIVNLVVQSPWTLNTTSMTSVATQSVLGCNTFFGPSKVLFRNLSVSV